jgi:hypothetical protein
VRACVLACVRACVRALCWMIGPPVATRRHHAGLDDGMVFHSFVHPLPDVVPSTASQPFHSITPVTSNSRPHSLYVTPAHTPTRTHAHTHTSPGGLLVPETELYEILAVQRRRLVTWCNSKLQGPLDATLQAALEISTSAAGAFVHRHADVQNRWSKITGARCVGRYAVASTRSSATGGGAGGADGPAGLGLSSPGGPGVGGLSMPMLTRQPSWDTPVGSVAESAFVGVELDLQIGQMTLRNRHLSALKQEILNHGDVRAVFGATGTIQASQLSDATCVIMVVAFLVCGLWLRALLWVLLWVRKSAVHPPAVQTQSPVRKALSATTQEVTTITPPIVASSLAVAGTARCSGLWACSTTWSTGCRLRRPRPRWRTNGSASTL